MAITIPSGFNITVQQPVDARMVLTKAQMAAMVEAKMPTNYLALCSDDGKLYLYNVNNTSLSTTGKFRVFEGGEPDAYLKSAAVSGNKLTLTKQDDSTVIFEPQTGGTYTAGENIQISDQNVISATDTKYTAGTNVQINNNVISATDTTYTAGAGIDISNNVIAIDANSGIAIYDNRISDANQWLTNGYTKTSAEIPTANLPSVCTENDRWGVLLYVAENNENKAGLQQYFPIDGTYKGRVFYRSVTGYDAETEPDFGEWELVPWSREKQDTLVSGTNIKTVNSNSLLGSGNLAIKTYQPFPTGDPEQRKGFKTDGTLQELVDSVSNYEGGYEGMAFLGGIEGQCVPDPSRIGNVECKVEYMADGLAVLTASSSNIEPYHWELNTAGGEWRKYSDVSVSSTGTATNEVQYITVDGTEYKLAGGGAAYTAGTNISIENNVISAIDTKIATSITLGKEITAGQTVGGITEGTVYSADTTLAQIIEDLLSGSGPTPGTEVTLYYGASSAIPTGLSGLTSTTVQSAALVGDHAYTIVCEDEENGQYPVFAVPVGHTLSKWVTTAAPAFPLEFVSITAENYNIYYLVETVYDAPSGTNYTFTIA